MVGVFGDSVGYADHTNVPGRVVVPAADLDLTTAALVEQVTVTLGTVERFDLQMAPSTQCWLGGRTRWPACNWDKPLARTRS